MSCLMMVRWEGEGTDQQDHGIHQVMHILQRATLLSVSKNDQIFTLECFDDEVADHSTTASRPISQPASLDLATPSR